MKAKKLLSGILAGAMVLSTMAFTAFAEVTDVFAIGENRDYTTFSSAVAAVTDSDLDGIITYEIYGKVVIDKTGWVSPVGSSNATIVNFVGKTADAELNIPTSTATVIGIDGKVIDSINFTDLICSRTAGEYVGDLGFANRFFTTWMRGAPNGIVTYTNCAFPNGVGTNQYGETVFANCSFSNPNYYALWVLGGKVDVTDSIFNGARGVKIYSEDSTAKPTTLIKNSSFENINEKPAIVSSQPGTVTLTDVDFTNCAYGIAANELRTASSGLADITIDSKMPDYKAMFNGNHYTSVEFAELEANGQPVTIFTAKIGSNLYHTLADAVDAVEENGTINVLADCTLTEALNINKDGVTIIGDETTKPKITVSYPTALISINGKNVTLKNLSVGLAAKTTSDINAQKNVITALGEGALIENCDFSGKATLNGNIRGTNANSISLRKASIVRNCNFVGGFRQMGWSYTGGGEVLIEGCSFSETTYGVNFDELNGGKLTLKDCVFNNTWNSFGTGSAEFVVDGCTFNGQNGTAILRPYVNTTIKNTKFSDGFVDLGNRIVPAKDVLITMDNCSIIDKDGDISKTNVLSDVCNLEDAENAIFAIDANQNSEGKYISGTFVKGGEIPVADGYTLVKNADGAYLCVPVEQVVATSDNGTTYADIGAAAEALYSGDATEITIGSTDTTITKSTEKAETYNVGSATAQVTSEQEGIKVSIPSVIVFAAENSNQQVNYAVKLEYKGRTDDVDSVSINADISIVKTVGEASEEISLGGKEVIVTVNIPNAAGKEITIYHNGSKHTVAKADANGNITFKTNSFSPYTFTYDLSGLVTDEASEAAQIILEKVETASTDNSETYNIILENTNTDIPKKPLTNIVSAQMNIAVDLSHLTSGMSASYTVDGANDFVMTQSGNSYLFNLPDGINSKIAEKSGDKVQVGTIVVSGYTYAANETPVSIDAYVTTAQAEYKVATDGIKKEVTVTDGSATYSKQVPTRKLTINVDFPNAITDNAAAYQDMTVTIKGIDCNETYNLGTDSIALVGGSYVITNDKLTYNTTYLVTVQGGGYRTVKQSVKMNANKVMTVWNNVMNTAKAIVTVDGANETATVNTSFLAGEIVKDDQINIYDLSAVVSYFGKTNDKNDFSAYGKYDLNRDGKIDSKDVAYVLVSWGK